MRLPNSGPRISFSIRHYRFASDEDAAVLPDVRIEPSWEAFRAGKDPILDWILSQP